MSAELTSFKLCLCGFQVALFLCAHVGVMFDWEGNKQQLLQGHVSCRLHFIHFYRKIFETKWGFNIIISDCTINILSNEYSIDCTVELVRVTKMFC